MRGYLPISIEQLSSFMNTGKITADRVFAPTIKFLTSQPDLDQEEIEYELSLLAAALSLSQRAEGKSQALILALELDKDQIGADGQESVEIISSLRWNQVQCAFLCNTMDDELVWFATQEIADQLPTWSL